MTVSGHGLPLALGRVNVAFGAKAEALIAAAERALSVQ